MDELTDEDEVPTGKRFRRLGHSHSPRRTNHHKGVMLISTLTPPSARALVGFADPSPQAVLSV